MIAALRARQSIEEGSRYRNLMNEDNDGGSTIGSKADSSLRSESQKSKRQKNEYSAIH